MSNQKKLNNRVVGSGLGMFKFVLKPSQPIGDHPLWPCSLREVSHFVRHSYALLINTMVIMYYNVAPPVISWFLSRSN